MFCLNNVYIKNLNFNEEVLNSIRNAIEYDISQLDCEERTNTFKEHLNSLTEYFSILIGNIELENIDVNNKSFYVSRNNEIILYIKLS